MTRDEHPEHLLDRALMGQLETAERALLAAHLTICSACALHLSLATRIRSGTATAARDQVLNGLAIAGALERLRAPQARSVRRVGWMSLRWAVPSLLLAAGVAVAAAVTLRGARAPEPVAASVLKSLPAPVSAAADKVASAPAARAAAPTPTPAEWPAMHPAKPLPSAAVLFARASDLRRQGHLEQAIDTYRALQQRYPRTREANLSFALAGRLQLERDRPARALAEFDRYLRIDAEVAEEALAGRAEALDRLGRPREEAAGWRLLLERFPGSVYSGQARTRLAALDQAAAARPAGGGSPGRR